MFNGIRPTLAAALTFAFHVVVAGLLFGLIAIVAAALYVFAHFLQDRDWVPEWIATGIGVIESLIFIVDALCFVWFVILEAYNFCGRVWDARRDR